MTDEREWQIAWDIGYPLIREHARMQVFVEDDGDIIVDAYVLDDDLVEAPLKDMIKIHLEVWPEDTQAVFNSLLELLKIAADALDEHERTKLMPSNSLLSEQ